MTTETNINGNALPRRRIGSLRDRVLSADRSDGGKIEWEEERLVSTDQPSASIKLWDNVHSMWSLPMDRNLAERFYLRKIVDKCSACVSASQMRVVVEGHIGGTITNYEAHGDAELGPIQTERGEPYQVCSGCGRSFLLRKQQGKKHLEGILRDGPTHREATVLTINQFLLEPPTPVAVNVNNDSGPVDIQVERSERRRSRGRRRRRRR